MSHLTFFSLFDCCQIKHSNHYHRHRCEPQIYTLYFENNSLKSIFDVASVEWRTSTDASGSREPPDQCVLVGERQYSRGARAGHVFSYNMLTCEASLVWKSVTLFFVWDSLNRSRPSLVNKTGIHVLNLRVIRLSKEGMATKGFDFDIFPFNFSTCHCCNPPDLT